MSELVTPHVALGGIRTAYIMVDTSRGDRKVTPLEADSVRLVAAAQPDPSYHDDRTSHGVQGRTGKDRPQGRVPDDALPAREYAGRSRSLGGKGVAWSTRD